MRDKILKLISDTIKNDDLINNCDIDLFEFGILDSFDIITILSEIDRQYHIKISPVELKREEINTFNKLLDVIEKSITIKA
jgi:D-alanine--poly(phosphoribitol) ligase subunit 2